MAYTFQLRSKDILAFEFVRSGDIPIIHSGWRNAEEPFVVSAPIHVTNKARALDILIPAGFRYDAASVPVFFRRMLPKTHPKIWRAALVHDFLYANRIGLRKHADLIFLEIMEQDGLDLVRRNAAYQAVRLFGQAAWDDDD